MNESVAARRLGTALAFSYPLLAHAAVTLHSVALTVGAVALLAALILVPGLLRGSRPAWLALPFVVVACWLLTRTPKHVLPLYAMPVLVPALLAWTFGQTLLPGRTPLIEQIVRLLDPRSEIDAAVWPYARRLTLAWTSLFVALASTNFLLAALAEPDGLLLAAGVRPPLTVPQEWWSLFANLIGYLLVAAFFIIEYAYRRRRFPQQPHRNMLEFVRNLMTVMPQLVGRALR